MPETIDTAAFVDGLLKEQKQLDEQTALMAQEIVDNRRLDTLEDAKQFAKNWIETAAQHARNEQYWRERARTAEAKIASMTTDNVG